MKNAVLQKIILMSRLMLYGIFVQVFFISMLSAGDITAQQKSIYEIRLDINLREKKVADFFKYIEKKTDFKFTYNSSQVNLDSKVSIKAEGKTLGGILEDISRVAKINFRRIDMNIHVSQKYTSSSQVEEVITEPLPDISVSGKVLDEAGQPLPGATVALKGSPIGTITDADGSYRLSLPDDATTLVVSFVGYRSKEINISGEGIINVQMEVDVASLAEVVVVGYGQVNKRDLTGSVSQVKNEELEVVPVYNLEQALKGRAAGVRVTQNSGAPGSRIEVRIRGGNSMMGSNEPLYVVDGFAITGGIDYLNPADIESIDILKDASATAIYGSRGANGVVIITSKKGKTSQDGRVEVNTFYGVQQDVNRYELLDAKEYAMVANELLLNSGQEPYFDLNAISGSGTDWQDEIFRVAPIQNHTLTFSGSSDKTRYSLSGNYFNQEGIIINSGARRGSFRLNLDHEANSWLKMSTNLNLSRRDRLTVPVDNGNYGGSSIFSAAVSAAPTLPVYDEAGLPTRVGEEYSWGEATMQNPMIYASPFKSRTFSNSLVGNVNLEFKLTDELSFKTLSGLEYDNYITESFIPIIYSNDRGSAYEGNSYRNSFLNENVLNYKESFGGIHDLDVIGGFTYQNNYDRYSNISVNGFANNTTENFDLSAAETIGNPGSGNSEWALVSWLGRANYTLSDKYLFTASVRSDGSSRFGKENKWGFFPSGAFAWRISDEAFMENVTLVSDLKLRASYGKTGNTALNPYQSLDRMSSVKAIYGNQADVIGFVPSSISNKELKWETTTQLDVGFDFNVLENRLRFTFDYYKKNTTDLLASVPLPPSMGFGSILKNIGEIENSGVELLVSADILTNSLKWNVSGNISTNKNEIISLADGNDIYGFELNLFRSSLNIARVGQPFGAFYGLIENGLDENGFITYVDNNGDGVINSLDRVIIGNPYPDFIYGFNSNLSYKGFEFNLFIEGVQGNDIFWATAGTHLNSFQRGNNQFADLIGNYWTEENPDPNAKYPKISPTTLIDVSDRFIKDGSYLRIKAMKLAYNIPPNTIRFLRDAQVYISGTNLLTFTNYPGTDPEANTTGTDEPNVGIRLRVGIDQSAYPSPRVFATGLKFSF